MVSSLCRIIFALITLILLGGARQAAGFDWYRWRGPNLDGVSKETGWLAQWPKEGPKKLWKARVGVGFSSVSVANGRVYTMGNIEDKETVYCFDAESGESVWEHSYDCETDPHYYEGGPSSTPTVDGQRVYTLSRKGHLFCFDAVTGKVVWQENIAAETGARIPEWGFAGSPLVEGELLILNAGAAGTAVNKSTGKVVWTSGHDAAAYSTAVPFNAGSERCVALMAAQSVVAVRVKDGRKLWQHNWKTAYDVNAADPIIAGDKVFISSGYNHGCALLKFSGSQTSVVWENKNMRNHFNPCVLINGFLYGFDGDTGREAILKCVEWQTGAVKWAQRGLGAGALTAADGKLIVLGDRGEMMIAEASPEACKPLARAQVIGGKCWTAPVLANGRIYCRNAQGDLVCLEVKAATT